VVVVEVVVVEVVVVEVVEEELALSRCVGQEGGEVGAVGHEPFPLIMTRAPVLTCGPLRAADPAAVAANVAIGSTFRS